MSTFDFTKVNDNDSSLQSTSGGVFGLNRGCFISKFEFSREPKKKDGTVGSPAVAIEVTVGDKPFWLTIYDPTGAEMFGKNNVKLKPGDEGYDKKFKEEMNQRTATFLHVLKATGVTQAQVDAIMQNPQNGIDSFCTYVEALMVLLPVNYMSKPVDVFLEWQYSIATGQTKTFLTLPSNMKGGKFICPASEGEWKEETEWTDKHGVPTKGLRYVNPAGEVLFGRNQNFMESNKGHQQDNSAPQAGMPQFGGAIANTAGAPGTW